jgi:hypothetical protein
VRGIGEQDRRIAVDRLLSLRAAARARARGEHDGVGAAEVFCHLGDRGVLQVPTKPSAPAASRSATWSGLRISPRRITALDSSRSMMSAILPCPPAITMRMCQHLQSSGREDLGVVGECLELQ